MDWFRWHHGSVTDPKFQLVARQAGASLPDVLAVWTYMLETASQSTDRGEFGDLDAEAIDLLFGFPDGKTVEILAAMAKRGLIGGERITSWEKRQPKREREDDTAADRKRAQRERETSGSTADVTPSHATSHQVTPRLDEIRLDKKEEISPAVAEKKNSRKTQIPPDFHPNDAGVKAAESVGLDLKAEIRRFVDFHEGKGSVMASWDAAWRTWIGKAVEFGRGKPAKPSGEAAWLIGTPFTDTFEAHNAGCFAHNVSKFRTEAPA